MKKLRKHAARWLLMLLAIMLSGCGIMGGAETGPETTRAPESAQSGISLLYASISRYSGSEASLPSERYCVLISVIVPYVVLLFKSLSVSKLTVHNMRK